MGVHPTEWGYSVHDDITDKLVSRGIPRNQIAAIGDADSDAKKQALFDRVRSGTVRVLIGSTQKMGTGTNVQKRLVALHHLDAPWKPAEVEQREGRILRQGNSNEEVAIYRYVTEGSFDAYMWQALETKARFIAQVMTGDSAVRRAEDIGGQELSYAEVKAIASGNPAVLTLAEADAESQRLAILKKNHADEQYVARRRLKELPATIAWIKDRITDLTKDMAVAAAHEADPMTLSDRRCLRDQVPDVLAGLLNSLPFEVRETCRFPLGVFRGLKFGLVMHPHSAPQVYLEGAVTCQEMLTRDHPGPRAVLNALDRIIGTYDGQCDKHKEDLSIAESQIRDYQARLGVPFSHEAYLTEVNELRGRLKAALSGAPPEPSAGVIPTPELAARFKALKAAHTIEPAPQRQGNRAAATADEPVTTRIRTRTGKNRASAPADEPEPVEVENSAAPLAPHQPGDAATPSAPEITLPPERPAVEDSASPQWQAVARQKPRRERQMSIF
jgi:hypothetical protein